MYLFIQQILNGLTLGSIYGLIAIGYTMVYGIIGMINFAHGEVFMVSCYITAISIFTLAMLGVSQIVIALVITLPIAMFITSLLGMLLERVAYKPLRKSTKLAPLITAIGVSLTLQNFVQLVQGAQPKGMPTFISGNFRLGTEDDFAQITYTQVLIIFITFFAMFGMNLLINKTKLGRSCRATQQDLTMAGILGINTDRVIMSVFIIGASLAAVGGILVVLNYGSFDFFIGFIYGIKAFTAAVLGGIGSIPGAMLGGLILGMSESLFAGWISSSYKDVFAFSLLVFVLLFKPAGLLGRPAVQKV